mmetsp:Transcript_72572/g.173177  ORF Transcript_72572/g.173177 Transcript_72572/m.173177 type:complete len:235 (+) Transcript_72572:627-1331(+)
MPHRPADCDRVDELRGQHLVVQHLGVAALDPSLCGAGNDCRECPRPLGQHPTGLLRLLPAGAPNPRCCGGVPHLAQRLGWLGLPPGGFQSRRDGPWWALHFAGRQVASRCPVSGMVGPTGMLCCDCLLQRCRPSGSFDASFCSVGVSRRSLVSPSHQRERVFRQLWNLGAEPVLFGHELAAMGENHGRSVEAGSACQSGSGLRLCDCPVLCDHAGDQRHDHPLLRGGCQRHHRG